MKSELAKARDEWLQSDEGKDCCRAMAQGRYLQNRLRVAFLAGAKYSEERINKDLLEVYERIDTFLSLDFPRMTATQWAVTVGNLKNLLSVTIAKAQSRQSLKEE